MVTEAEATLVETPRVTERQVEAPKVEEPKVEIPVEEKTEVPEVFVPPEALETVDEVLGTLPEEYKDEIFATDLLDFIGGYHKMVLQRKAARHQEDHKRAEELSKNVAFFRSCAALIQYEHPNTKSLYQELARLQVMRMRKNRQALEAE